MSKQDLLDLIDKAGKGSIEAAEAIAEGYFKGSFDGKKNLEKAKKWVDAILASQRPDGSFGNRVGDWSDIIDLDYSNKELWRYQIDTLKQWAEIVDGWTDGELSTLIDYRYEQGVTRISYIRNTFRFNCDWKRRLFATSFAACCEMVVTDHEPAKGRAPISGRDSFDSRDAFYDKVDFFLDPLFWEDYNIIEPSVSLDEAIDKLLKKRIKR